MRSGYLILLAAALGVSAKPTVIAARAEAWGECSNGTEQKGTCPSGFKCDAVNSVYGQCVPVSYLSKRDAGINANSDPGVPPTADIEKRQTPASIPVRGAQSTNGACYHRYKIQTLQTSHATQFNMLICALEDLQKQPEVGDLSWFGIGGIHGAPYMSWPRGTTGNFNQGLGYCVHGGPLFATWHRPYTLLLEQALQARAVAIAAKFTGSSAAAYRTAADQLRLPYWDWSDPVTRSDIPAIMMQATISVTKPSSNGTPVSSTIPNPLFQYNFQSAATLKQYFSGNYANWMYTTRHPRSSSDPTPVNADANTIMRNGFTTRRQQTYQLFSMTSFNSMASQLEGIHNQIHTNIGGTNPLGHMSVTNVASFDPIFWLHHGNVDRMVALYQAIYPDNRLQPSPGRATFGRIVPGIDGPNDDLFTNLYPFRLPSGAWWKSNEIKSVGTIWKYRYGYDEIPCSMYTSGATRSEISAFARQKVNALYATTSTGVSKKTRRSAAASPDAYASPDPKRYPHQPGFTPGKDKPVVVRNEYGIRCTIDHSEIPGSWTGHILFTSQPCGKVSPNDYFMSKDRIAGFSSFGAPFVRHDSMAYSQDYPITDNLIERKVNIDNVSVVEKWLHDNLKVCFTTGDDEIYEVPTSSLKTWKVGVYMQEGKYPEGLRYGNILPAYGDKEYLSKVTKEMPGGITSEVEIIYPVLLDGRVVDLDGDGDTY
ncbi:hypothetical protein EV426DRAFT_678991 [Tirmania nivea]|nr:hypothetical protein EV426DRAFT_678991 [Tirmania nivea]